MHVRFLSQLVVGTLVCMSKITMHAVFVSQAVLIACTVPLQEGARGVWERPLTESDRPTMHEPIEGFRKTIGQLTIRKLTTHLVDPFLKESRHLLLMDVTFGVY